MKARPMLAALILAGAISSSYAKDNPHAGPPAMPPAAEQALGPLIDAFLEGEPPGQADSPAGGPDFQSHRPEWQALGGPPYGNAYGHTSAIPEPDTYALMLAGLGMLYAIGRRLKDKGPDA